MKTASIIRLVVTALVVTLLSPFSASTPAQANGTITKTITVKGHDGALLSGASVLITAYPEVKGGSVLLFSGTTNSQGVATINIPAGSSGDISVAPSVTDLQNSISKVMQESYFGPEANSPVTFNLEKANIRFVLKNPDGSDAQRGLGFSVRGQKIFMGNTLVARSGAFGFTLPSNLTPGANYDAGYSVMQADVYDNKSLFSFRYGLRAAGAAGSQTYKVFTNRNYTTEIAPNSDGAFPLVVSTGNIVGQLKDASGNNVTIPTGVSAQVNIQKLNSAGSLDTSTAAAFLGAGGTHFIYPDGSFPGRVLGGLAGKYRVNVTFAGSSTLPTFTNYIYQDADGKFSTTDGSGYLPTPFALNLVVPSTPTLKIKSFLPGTSTPDTSTYIEYTGEDVVNSEGDLSSSYLSTYPTGSAIVVLANGTYTFKVRSSSSADNGYDKTNNYTVVVSGGVTTSVVQGSTTISPSSDGFYGFEGRSGNLKIVLVDSSTGMALTDFYVNIYLNPGDGKYGNYVTGAGSSNGQSRIIVDQGSYILDVYPQSPGYSQQKFFLTVGSNLVPTITGVAPQAGIFTLPIKAANAKLQFKISGTPSSTGYLDFCQGPSQHDYTSCNGIGFDEQGRVYKNLEPGNYYLVVRPQSSGLAPKTYTATVDSQSVLTVAGSTIVDGHWQVTAQTPNVRFKVVHPITGGLVSNGWINIQKVSSDGNHQYWLPNAELRSVEPGLTSTYAEDGNYIVIVNPNSDASVSGLARKRYVMNVVGGVASISAGGAAVTKDGEKWVLTLANANLNVKLKTPTGSALTNSWFDVCEDTGNGPTQTGKCDGQGVNEQGEGSINVEPGNYYLRVNPGSTQPFASKIYAMAVASDGTVTITGATKTGDYWDVAAAAPNLSGKILGPTGETLTLTNNQAFDIQLQKWESSKNFWQYVGGQWKNAPEFNFNVTAAGKYRLLIRPYGISQFTSTASNPVWVNGSSQIATTEGGSYGSSLSNFNIQLKTPNVLIDFINPKDNSLIPFGWISAFSVDSANGNQSWFGNGDIASDNPGKIGFNFDDGTYRLEVNPQRGSAAIPGLTRKQYKVVVSGSGSSVVMTGWKNTTQLSKSGSRFLVPAGSANITGRITDSAGDPLGNVSGAWTNINVQKLNTNGNWDWTDNWYNPDSDGYFNVNMEDPGTYRLLVEPNGRQNVTVTLSEQFTITSENAATFKVEYNPLKLNAPDLLFSVYQGDTPTAVTYLGVEVRKNQQWLNWANTGQNGVAAVSFAEAGTYQLVLRPNQEQSDNGFTQKTYEVVVTKDSSGVKTATISANAGATKVGSLNKLKLGIATLSGYLRSPDSSSVIASGTVLPISSTGQELWEYSSYTSSSGKWSMSLPAGTYTLQGRSPYGQVTYGNGDRIGTVTIAADGSATLSSALNGANPLNLTVNLKNPTWSGTVRTPGTGTDPIPFAWLCLIINNAWNCSQANQLGQWALSAPSGFTAFDASAELRIEDVQNRLYPTLIVRGATAVSAALGGVTATGLIHRLPSANVELTVTAGGVAASGIWVNLEEVGAGWLGANMTDAQGKAKFYVDPSKLSVAELRVRAEINGNPKYSNSYASSSKTFTGTGSAISQTLALAVPNFRATLREPTAGGVTGALTPFSWVELFRENGQGWDEWVSGTSTDSQGQFALFAPAINNAETKYIVRVNPPWNNTSISSSQDYLVTVNSGGSVTGVVIRSKPTVAAQSANVNGIDYWGLSLASPTIAGVVWNKNDQPIANSWIQPYDQLNKMWINGINSRNDGSFYLALKDGTYRLEANVPWGVTNTARSAQCSVTLLNNTVTTGGSCVQPDKSIKLKLRAPNVTFTLMSGSEAIPFASVGLGYGSWNTWAQSDAEGKVSLFVDPEAIAAANPSATGNIAPYMWVDPPWNANNKMVRWDCPFGASKPICSQLPLVTIGAPYPQKDLGPIEVLKPNTILAIKVPGTSTSIGAGAWINLISFGLNGANQTWAGSNTDSAGNAYFYLDTSTATADTRWGVTVNPPWDKRQQYSVKEFGTYQEYGDWNHGLTWESLTTTVFSPAVPNFTISVKRPTGGIANRYGWVQLEEVDSNSNQVAWKNGTSVNHAGLSSLLLAAGKRYRLTAYPNGGEGARTTCEVATDSANPIGFTLVSGKCAAGVLTGSSLVITLDQGNVTGTVKDSANVAVVGAIVAAIANDATTLTTTTNENGRFGLDLDLAKSWTITVIPSGTTLANKTLATAVTTAGELATIVLANR